MHRHVYARWFESPRADRAAGYVQKCSAASPMKLPRPAPSFSRVRASPPVTSARQHVRSDVPKRSSQSTRTEDSCNAAAGQHAAGALAQLAARVGKLESAHSQTAMLMLLAERLERLEQQLHRCPLVFYAMHEGEQASIWQSR